MKVILTVIIFISWFTFWNRHTDAQAERAESCAEESCEEQEKKNND